MAARNRNQSPRSYAVTRARTRSALAKGRLWPRIRVEQLGARLVEYLATYESPTGLVDPVVVLALALVVSVQHIRALASKASEPSGIATKPPDSVLDRLDQFFASGPTPKLGARP